MSDNVSDDSTNADYSACNGIGNKARVELKEEIVKDMAIEKMKERMEAVQTKVMKDLDKKLQSMMEDVMNEVKLFNLRNYELKNLFNEKANETNYSNKSKNKNGGLREKEFMARNSILTDLFEVKHIKTIYHIFIVILIIMFLNTVVHDFVDKGTINVGLRLIIAGFGKFDVTLLLWGCMQICTLCVYPCFSLWGYSRENMKRNKTYKKVWDLGFLLIFIAYQLAFIGVFVKLLLIFDLPPASSVAFLMEQVRFLMKCHAFVRSNVPRVLAGGATKTTDEDKPKHNCLIPPFSKYLYFLFAPTLVYRDEYPRTKKIRWEIVFRHSLEVIGVVFYISFIFERFLLPVFMEFGDTKISSGKFVLSIFGCMMPGSMAFLCGFYCLLHAWMNASSELLTFADRMFYKDWWNASNFAVYIRSWNIVVHDWLYTYIYKDVHEHVFKECRPIATILVFTVSALFHEYILAFAFRFFYPVMFVQFEFVGLLLMFLTNKNHKDFGNILMWLALCLGNGIHLSLYNMEYYARINCPNVGNAIADYFIPVSWTCNGISSNPDWKIQTPWNN